MKLARGVRKHGFRKWYERQLLQSHAHMLLTFLCAIGLLGAFEALGRFRSMQDQLTNIVAILVCAALGLWALRRYLRLLMHAEATAHQANCPHCTTYARFDLEGEDTHDGAIHVCCRVCKHRWTITG